jgi:3-methylcrotonyl-CoA carboxylase alpha subunit
VYLVELDGDEVAARRHEIVYVAGSHNDNWAFWNGRVFRQSEPVRATARPRTPGVVQSLTSPMPATIVNVLVTPGQTVKTGDTLVLVEAMKMELAIRAPGDGVVKAIHCREGEIVQPDRTLVELE